MFSESIVDEDTDFVPKTKWNNGFPGFCKKYCRNAEHCPIEYICPTMERWNNADLDNDNTL